MAEVPSEVVLITGSSGLIGSALVNRLSNQFKIAGFDNAGAPFPPAHVEAISVDLSNDAGLDYAFERLRYGYGKKIASVVHLAAYYSFSQKESPLYDQITVHGTRRLLEKLQDFEVDQFIFSSTMLVHAPSRPGQKINEESPLEPKWAYPASKVKTEKLIREGCGKIPFVLMRISGVYTDACNSIPLAHQIQRIYEKQLTSYFFAGDPTHGAAFMHLDDLIDAFDLAVQKRKQLARDLTLVIGEDQTLSYQDLQQEFGRLIHGRPWKTLLVPKPLAKIGAAMMDILPGFDPFIKPWMIDLSDDHYELDIARARQTLGWQPKHSLRATLPKMVQALKADPAKFYKTNKLERPSVFPV